MGIMHVFGLSILIATVVALTSCKEVVVTSKSLRDSNGATVAFNLGGATANSVVAFEDNTEIFINGTPLAMLNRGERFSFVAAQMDVLESTKPFFVAGRAGTNGAAAAFKSNIAWTLPDWAGRNFAFFAARTPPIHVTVFAFDDSTVELYQGGSPQELQNLNEGDTYTFVITTLGSYELISTGDIIVHYRAIGGGTNRTDMRPILPASDDIIGFPSQRVDVSPFNNNNISLYHSNGGTGSNTLTIGTNQAVTGIANTATSLYQTHALRIESDGLICGQQAADSNGNASAPFVPTHYVKYRRIYLNTSADYVAFVSLSPGTISVYDDQGNGAGTMSLSRTGGGNSPYFARFPAAGDGFRFESSVPVAAWYHPDTDNDASAQDETYIYGAEF